MGQPEVVTFDRGLITKRSPLLLDEGELVTAQGMSYDNPGVIEARTSKQQVNTTQYGTINGMHRNINTVLLTDAANVRYKWDLNGYCGLYTPANEDFTLIGTLANTNRPSFCDYEEFTFMVDGNAKKVFVGQNLYNWDIPGPVSAPTGAAGAAGNPSGTYSLYVTYLIYFPNGYAVETAPSPAGTVTVASQKITWSNIPICPYAGTGLTIHRKLFRYSTGLIEKYYVTTISDNTTTTYTDDFTDAQLELKSILDTEDYVIPPENINCIVQHLLRVFAFSANYVYPSEPYYPFNFKNTEALQVTSLGDDLVGGVSWGDQLFIASRSKWYRLAGNNSDTWQIKTTFAHAGSINRETIKATRYGIFSLWYDGIYLFDGNVSKNLTGPKIDSSLFTNISSVSSCYAEWDGRKYYFHYPESGTTISKRLVLDMGSYPDVVIYEEDFVPTAHSYHEYTGIHYYGFNGYQYEEGGADTVSLSIKTGDRAAKNILQHKQIEYLYYDINTGGKDVVISVYVDDVLAKSETVNTRVRTRERLLLPNTQGYRFSVEITAADARGVTIYEPWAVSVNITGV